MERASLRWRGLARGRARRSRRSAADGGGCAAGRLTHCSRVSAGHLLLVHQRAIEELPLVVVILLLVDKDRLLRTLRRKSDDSSTAECLPISRAACRAWAACACVARGASGPRPWTACRCRIPVRIGAARGGA